MSYTSTLSVGYAINQTQKNPYLESASGQFGDVYYFPGPVNPENVFKISLYFDVTAMHIIRAG